MRLPSLFKTLNIQFIFYFLLFSYIPLLIFSVLGYYLNRHLISNIHRTNIKEINQLTSKRVENIFSLNDLKVRFDAEKHFINTTTLDESNFIFLILDQNKVIYNSGVDSAEEKSLVSGFDQSGNNIIITDQNHLYKKIEFKNNLNILYQLSVNDIQNCLKSKYEPGVQHFLTSESGDFLITENQFELNVVGNESNQFNSVLQNTQNSADPDFKSEIKLNDGLILYSVLSGTGLYKELTQFLTEIIIANLFIGLLMFFIARFFSRRITNPIRSLVDAVHEISDGDMSHPITVKSNDEIKLLADEFEQMRQKLKESYTDLESKIEERTQALRDAQFQISHQEKMASLGLLAAGVAHEIGNPLTSISSMAQIIKRRVKDQNFIEYLNTILKNIDRIRKIVRELVDFARPSSYEAGDTDINELIRNAVGIVKYDRRAKSINIDLELDNNLPTLYLVADQLMQVFINILINAVDALTEEKNRIIIRSTKHGSDIVLQFEDSGIGIDEENKTKIFEPFFTTKRVGKGTGLGLSVSYGIIKNLNGTIEVESQPGAGSIFTITLPRTTRRS